MSNSLTDQLFDLELALTMVDDSAGVIQISDLSSSHRNDMPTMTASGFCREGDESFDLDQALTMVDDSTSVVEISDSSAPHRNDIQTVIASAVCTVCMESFRSGDGGKQVPTSQSPVTGKISGSSVLGRLCVTKSSIIGYRDFSCDKCRHFYCYRFISIKCYEETAAD
ncbi:unnamed protein product [Ilex paraguariensis]|uniref:Uncharacterized protein n=1 Tax=Ilex paraguariensis TaxID=185542 RepID=A0ABC8S8Z5_9AQUA